MTRRGMPEGVAVSGAYAYVADGWKGLRVVDVSNPAQPREVGSYDTPGWAEGVAVSGAYAYVADGGASLRVVDVSNPAQPREVGFYKTPGNAVGVAVSGAYAYVADYREGLRVVDVSNPAQPREVGFYDTPGYAYGVAVSGAYAYVADYREGLRVVDVSNPAQPREVGFYDTPGYAYGVAVSGAYAYVADGPSGLRVIDVSNPAAPRQVGVYDTPGWAEGVAVSGSYAYVADGGAGLRVVDVSNPAQPRGVGFYDTPGYAQGVAVSGAYVYVADGYYGGLRVVDVSNPAQPREVGFYDTLGEARGVAVSGSYIYVADREGGLVILRFTRAGTYSISGRVVDSSGNPISGVTVSDNAGHTTTTGSDGRYTLSGLAAGTYTITPSKSGYAFSPASRQVTVPPDATGVDFVGTPVISTLTPELSSDDPLHKVILKGRVNPQGGTMQVWFEWGTDPNLATYQVTERQTVSGGPATVMATISVPLGVKHFYRIAASNLKGNIVDFTILLGQNKNNPKWNVYDRLIEAYAARYDIPATLLKAVIIQESSLNKFAFRYEPITITQNSPYNPYILPDNPPSDNDYPRQYSRNMPWNDDMPIVKLPISITMGELWTQYSEMIPMSRPTRTVWVERAQWRVTSSYGLGQLLYKSHGDKIGWRKPETFYDPYTNVAAAAAYLADKTCQGDFEDFPLGGLSKSVLHYNWGTLPCKYTTIEKLWNDCNAKQWWCSREDYWTENRKPKYLVSVAKWLENVQPTLVQGVDTGSILAPLADTVVSQLPLSTMAAGETELDRLVGDLKGTGQFQLAVLYGVSNGSEINGVLRVFADAQGNVLEWESRPMPGVTLMGTVYTQTLSVGGAPLIIASWGVGAHGMLTYFFRWQDGQFREIPLLEEGGETIIGAFADASISVDAQGIFVGQRDSAEPLAVTHLSTYSWQDEQAAFVFVGREVINPIPFWLYLPLVIRGGR